MGKVLDRLFLRRVRLASTKAMIEHVERIEKEATFARGFRKPFWELQKKFFNKRVRLLKEKIGKEDKKVI